MVRCLPNDHEVQSSYPRNPYKSQAGLEAAFNTADEKQRKGIPVSSRLSETQWRVSRGAPAVNLWLPYTCVHALVYTWTRGLTHNHTHHIHTCIYQKSYL